MTPAQIAVIRAAIKVLRAPRNRFGKLETAMADESREGMATLNNYARLFNLPHGGYDGSDQLQMVLSKMIGEPCISIGDRKPTKQE